MRTGPVAVAAAALGAALVLVGAAAASSGSALLPCTPGQLSLSGPIEADGAGIFSFVNRSSRSCTLTGFPALDMRAANGRTALLKVVHGNLRGRAMRPSDVHASKQPVVLTPGHSGEFSVTWWGGQPSQYCLDPGTIMVSATPPGSTQPLTARFQTRGGVCQRVSVSYMTLVIPFA